MISVDKAQHSLPISYIIRSSTDIPSSSEEFEEEMLVAFGFKNSRLNELLKKLNEANITIKLKAVVTETNISWSGIKLCHELISEHSTLNAENK